MFIDNGVAISKNAKENWKWVLRGCVKHTCNALLIVDNYLFKNDFELKNVIELLDCLIPDKLETEFHLTIVSSRQQDIFNKDEMYVASDKRNKIEKEVKKIRPHIKSVQIEIFFVGNEFHDRSIVSNNIWIGAGSGFGLFNNDKPNKPTTIQVVYPYFCDSVKWVIKAYENVIKDARKALSNNGKISQNRLLRSK